MVETLALLFVTAVTTWLPLLIPSPTAAKVTRSTWSPTLMGTWLKYPGAVTAASSSVLR
jgi:hypothetical protein